MKKLVVIIVVLAILGSFLHFHREIEKRKALQSCELSLEDVQVVGVGLKSAELNIIFKIYNPNDITATLDKIEYSVYGNEMYVGDGKISERIDIPAHSQRLVKTQFTLYYSGAIDLMWSAIRKGEVSWRVSGTAWIDTPFMTMKIPFSESSGAGDNIS